MIDLHEPDLASLGLAELRAGFDGAIERPGDPGYDVARRVWNAMHDRRPRLIARCLNADDISAVVRYAVAATLPVTVRGGGHNVSGSAVADDAVMVDLSLMRGISVEPRSQVAQAQGGCLLRDLDVATTAVGLACPAGVVSHTGLGGLALGGGYGWLARKWGLTCDHVVGAEVVLADGSIVEVGEDNRPELLWALRGGGGNFGIVARFTLRLRPIHSVHRHAAVLPVDDAAAALAAYRRFAPAQTDDLHVVCALSIAGRRDWIPSTLHGKPAIFFTAVWLGDAEDAPYAIGPLFDGLGAAATTDQVMPYLELQGLGDNGEPSGNRYFTKSCYLSDLTPDPVECLVEATRNMRSSLSSIDFEFLRGAISAVPDGESAFPRRDAPYICTASAQWLSADDDAENAAWARRTIERLAPWHHGGAYVNYVQDEPEAKVAELYGDERYRRLVAVKRRYDPDNVFHSNQNVKPALDHDDAPREVRHP